MEVVDCFNVCQNVPSLKLQTEISAVLCQFKVSVESARKISNSLADSVME